MTDFLNTRHCERCGEKNPISTIMSKFNTEIICGECKKVEIEHPKYKEADEAECAAVLAGVRDFPGIGKPSDL